MDATQDTKPGPGSGKAAALDEERRELARLACASVDALRPHLLRVSHEIHAHPELAFEERRASALLCEAISAAGLTVKRPAYGLETAFESEFGCPGGPCVALLAEYDALPGIGHACGHNLIATAALGAGLALAALGTRLPGRVRLLGTPAEERGAGKEIMARAGAFDGVGAALMVHPAGVDLTSMPCIAVADVEVSYHGESAHASAMPERGINALDALVIAYQSIGALRQHIRSTERIHGIITHGGDAPNIVPERAAGRFYVRARNAAQLATLKQRVAGCFDAGARATGARLDVRWCEPDYLELRPSWPLAQAYQANAEALGRRFFPLERLPQSVAGSTDMGNVSQRVPSIHPMIAAAPPHCTIHHPEFAKWAASEMGDRAALDGAKALAMTALDFFCDDSLRASVRAAFERAQAAKD
ncbi:MAG: M20 family metallopeptidase [Deltaproteobacteria bacterium]|nr:M20 family metallopeptidase [Deltaproteobacteria bacterium]